MLQVCSVRKSHVTAQCAAGQQLPVKWWPAATQQHTGQSHSTVGGQPVWTWGWGWGSSSTLEGQTALWAQADIVTSTHKPTLLNRTKWKKGHTEVLAVHWCAQVWATNGGPVLRQQCWHPEPKV